MLGSLERDELQLCALRSIVQVLRQSVLRETQYHRRVRQFHFSRVQQLLLGVEPMEGPRRRFVDPRVEAFPLECRKYGGSLVMLRRHPLTIPALSGLRCGEECDLETHLPLHG